MSLALLLGGVNAACVNFRPPPAPVAANADAPVPLWTTRTGRRFSSPLEIRDNILYGGSVDRKVYAVDLGSGDVRWGRRLSGMLVGGVLLPGDTLYAATSRPEGRVYALRRANGKQIWYQSISPIAAPLALVDRVLVAQTQRGEVLGLDPGNGKIRWRRRVGVSRVAAAPAGEGGVLVATTDSLIRLTLIDGKVTHRTHSPGTIVSAWIPYPGGLVAGTTDSQVVSVDPRNLRVNWSVRLDAPVLGSPGLMGDTLFVASRLGTVYRIDPAPEPKARQIAALDWPVTAPLAIVNDKLLLGGADGTIRALRSDGSEIWRVRVWRPVEIGPVPMADGLVAIGGNGDLHRYRQ
ncbi:MAG: PQQ-binding-like beta-propeller repeat protein [Gemmatimonadales bacterium]